MRNPPAHLASAHKPDERLERNRALQIDLDPCDLLVLPHGTCDQRPYECARGAAVHCVGPPRSGGQDTRYVPVTIPLIQRLDHALDARQTLPPFQSCEAIDPDPNGRDILYAISLTGGTQ